MPRSLTAVLLAVFALIGAPAAATVITVSAVNASIPAGGSAAAGSAADAVTPAVWVWGATGLVGLGAMVTFGATVVRRGSRAADLESVLVEPALEVAAPRYA